MTTRSGWMQAKLIKQKRERRAWARPLSIKSSAGPNWHNGKIAREAPASPDAFIAAEIKSRNDKRAINARGQDVKRVPDISEIRKDISDPFFTATPCDTPYHRCRIFWNSQRTLYILQYTIWPKHIVKISHAYPTAARAWYAFLEDQVRWRKTSTF